MSSAAPISYGSLAGSFDKNQNMPLQYRAPAPKKTPAKEAKSSDSPAPSHSTPSTSSSTASPPPSSVPSSASSSSSSSSSSVLESYPAPISNEIIKLSAPAARKAKDGKALVVSVSSGDSVTLLGSVDQNSAAPKKQLTLAGINAPKFARGKTAVDEPYAWESREYLRKKVIGQQVSFSIQNVDPKSGREYGSISLHDQNLANEIVAHGWAVIKEGARGKDGTVRAEYAELADLQERAQKANLGVHQKTDKTAHVRQINFAPDAAALYAKYKGVLLPGVVDKVLDGSTYRIELTTIDKPLHHSVITLHLSGVQCNRTPLPAGVKRSSSESKTSSSSSSSSSSSAVASSHVASSPSPPKDDEEEAEEWSIEAQNFAETRLLHRDVQVLLQGLDKANNLFGTIIFSKGNIALKLLELGYGRLVAWSAALTDQADALKAAEAQAKGNRLRLWESHTGEVSDLSTLGTDFQAKVIQVVSGDTIVVIDPNNEERRVSLASIRAPRLGRRTSDKSEPYADDAKEFVRSKLIGHKVRVQVEYSRPAPEKNASESTPKQFAFASVTQGKVNIGEALVAAGLARVVIHRMDEPRAANYEQLIQAEQQAQTAQKGIHNTKAAASAPRIVDLTDKPPRVRTKKAVEENGEEKTASNEKEEAAATKAKAISAKAKTFLSFFQREKNITGVVEYVFNGSRFKVLVPKEHVIISFALSGIRTPARVKPDGKPDKYFDEATQFVRKLAQQHTVRIEVEVLDRADTFIGNLFINKTNLAVTLLEEGLAQVFGYSAEKSKYSRELFEAEAKAKAEKKGLWADWVEPVVPEKPATENGDEEHKELKDGKEFINVKVTDIEDVNDFFVHFVDDKGVEALETAMKTFGEAADAESSADPYHPPRNQSVVCAGRFTDGDWYRVRVEGATSSGSYRVFFLDYGNHELLDPSDLRELTPELAKIPALAHRASLAGLKAPSNEDYKENAALEFNALVWGQHLLAKVEFIDKNKVLHLTLLHESSPVSVNKQLLRDGWARVTTRPDRRIKALADELKEDEEFARKNHYNIFEYGDISDDEDDKRDRDLPPRKGAAGAAAAAAAPVAAAGKKGGK